MQFIQLRNWSRRRHVRPSQGQKDEWYSNLYLQLIIIVSRTSEPAGQVHSTGSNRQSGTMDGAEPVEPGRPNRFKPAKKRQTDRPKNRRTVFVSFVFCVVRQKPANRVIAGSNRTFFFQIYPPGSNRRFEPAHPPTDYAVPLARRRGSLLTCVI